MIDISTDIDIFIISKPDAPRNSNIYVNPFYKKKLYKHLGGK